MTTTTPVAGTAVASVARAMRVLQAFADHPGGVSLTRLSGELGYGKPSLSKIMKHDDEVTARDFGLGVRPPNGNGRARPARWQP